MKIKWKAKKQIWLVTILACLLLSTMLCGCGRQEAVEDDNQIWQSEAGNQTTIAENNSLQDNAEGITLSYDSGGDAPTVTTLTFYPKDKTVLIHTSAAGMYVAECETMYEMISDGISIKAAENVDAVMPQEMIDAGVATFFPEKMTASIMVTTETADDGIHISVFYGDINNEAAATPLGDFVLTEDIVTALSAG